MSIINLGWHDDATLRDGAYSPVEYKRGVPQPCAYFLYETHKGLCLKDYENNGYHDSDFYMLVWNKEKAAPESILFASTRGWSYPCYGSKPDATPEIRAEYAAWQQRQETAQRLSQRRAKAVALCALRAQMREIAKEAPGAYFRLLKLRRAYCQDDFARLLGLFSSRIRSAFKRKLREQVAAWLRDPAPRYSTPLSRKQFDCI